MNIDQSSAEELNHAFHVSVAKLDGEPHSYCSHFSLVESFLWELRRQEKRHSRLELHWPDKWDCFILENEEEWLRHPNDPAFLCIKAEGTAREPAMAIVKALLRLRLSNLSI